MYNISVGLEPQIPVTQVCERYLCTYPESQRPRQRRAHFQTQALSGNPKVKVIMCDTPLFIVIDYAPRDDGYFILPCRSV